MTSPARRTAARVPPEPEAVLLRKVRALAKINHWRCYHTQRSDHSEPGFPDCVLVKPGRPVLFAELKSARGRLSVTQQEWLADLALANVTGVQVYVWRPGDVEQIAAVLAS